MRISDWSSDVCSSDLTEGHSLPSLKGERPISLRCIPHLHGLAESLHQRNNLALAHLERGPVHHEASGNLHDDAGFHQTISLQRCTRRHEIHYPPRYTERRSQLQRSTPFNAFTSEARHVRKECARTCRSRWGTH